MARGRIPYWRWPEVARAASEIGLRNLTYDYLVELHSDITITQRQRPSTRVGAA